MCADSHLGVKRMRTVSRELAGGHLCSESQEQEAKIFVKCQLRVESQ